MHILLANQWYPPEGGWGGLPTYNHAMAHAYRALGHQVTVITARLADSIAAESELDGIHILRLLVGSRPRRWHRVPGLGQHVRSAQYLLYSWRVRQAIRQVHARRPVDVVEFADVNAEGFWYARAPETPLVVRCHTPAFVLARCYNRHEMPYNMALTAWCEKSAIRRATALTAPSLDMARVIAAECDLPLTRISVIPNALCTSDFDGQATRGTRAPGSEIRVLQVGRLERAKGAVTLAQAIPQVLAKIPHVRFLFAGADRLSVSGTSQRAELEQQLAKAGVRTQVEFVGEVDQARLIELYRQADICVVPSMLYESFSYTCAQAMAAGKPVVASRVGGIPETVDDGINGVLCTPGDSQELAEAILWLASDPALRQRIGQAGREKAHSVFDPIRVAQRNVEVYEQARGNFQPRRRPPASGDL